MGLTSEQMRACPRMGSRQHLACWPSAAQVEMKVLTSAGVVGAVKLVSEDVGSGRRERQHTRSAVQVGEVQDVGSAADWGAGVAETNLALIERSGEGGGGSESQDGGDGELHFGGDERKI